MKSLVSLWGQLATELADLCGTDASRDIKTVSRRCNREGDAFLRITLPTFGKAFDQALHERRFSSDLLSGFHLRGGLPAFLQGFLRNIFAPDGAMIDVPCTESIRSVRQLCAVFGKIEGDCTPWRQRAAVREYIKADDACAMWDLTAPSSLIKEMIDVSNRALVAWLAPADRKIRRDELTPRHGPGQTADRLLGNQKYDLAYWPDHLESRFPWIEWGVPNYRYGNEGQPLASSHVVKAQQTLVPKTMSTPRVIVMEPTSLQYMQQGIMALMVETIERSTSQVGFTDQTVNQKMAREGSLHGNLVTLDLSEASDRVTYLQAASVFSGLPHLWEALDATRSSEVELALGLGNRPIHKFASMGSATCFPVEAVTFWIAILMAVRRYHRKTDPWFDLTVPFLRLLEGEVRVYGDDIIIPVEYLSEVREVFDQLGWKINLKKSFWKSNFRESCGGEYWDGHDVTPVRLRQPLPTTLRQTQEIQGLVSFRNQLYLAGYWRTTSFLDDRIHRLLRGTFPIVSETSPALGRTSVCFEGLALGTDRYQRALTRAFVTRTVIPKNECSEIGALLKCLIAPGKDDEHLERSGRPVDVSIHRRWVPVH